MNTEADPRDPLTRLSCLLDRDSLTAVHDPDESGARAVRGSVDGGKVLAYCFDARRGGSAFAAAGCGHVIDAIDAACQEGTPVVGLWPAGGAKLTEGVEALHAVGGVFAAIVRASGRVPQISVVLGALAGDAAYGPALTDLVIMSDRGRMFATGPSAIKAVTGEEIDVAGLGGPGVHGRRSGTVHVVAASEASALRRARRLAGLFAHRKMADTAAARGPDDLSALLPARVRRAYDVRPLIGRILDADGEQGFQELQPRWAPNMVVGLGRLVGGTVGVIANNPLHKAGCLDSLSAEKAAGFVRMCDSFGIPLLVLVDVPGYLPGVRQEWDGVVRRGAKLLHAFAESSVPRVTLITRKAYGGAYIAMNSRSLGATAVYAWPDAEIAVMSPGAAVDILHRKVLAAASTGERDELRARLVHRHRATTGGLARALSVRLG